MTLHQIVVMSIYYLTDCNEDEFTLPILQCLKKNIIQKKTNCIFRNIPEK